MPSNLTWTGASSGDVTVAGNWVGGVAPVNGDSVYFTAGAISATSGTLVNVVNFVRTAGFTGNIGASGTPLATGTITTLKLAGGGGFTYLSCGNITTMQVDGGNVSIAGAGTLATAYIGDATVSLSIAAVTTLMQMTPASNVTIETSGTAITTFWSYGRTTVKTRNITTGTIVGPNARLVMQETSLIATALTVDAGAIYNKQSSTTDVLVTIRGRGSLVSPAGNPFPLTPTITTVTIYTGGSIILMAGGVTLTVGTLTYIGLQSSEGLPP